MDNLKCNLYVVGRPGIGKTFLINSLVESNLRNIDTRISLNNDYWEINTPYNRIILEIKETRKIDKATIGLIEKNQEQKKFILYITPFYHKKENTFSLNEDIKLLKRLSEKATIMVAIVSYSNESASNLFLAKFKAKLPFVEFFFPIRQNENAFESIYEFSFALRQIIRSIAPNEIELAKKLIRWNFIQKEKILDLGNCNLTSLNQIKELFRNTHLESLILSNEWGEYKNGEYIRRVSANDGLPNILFSIPKDISKLKKLKVFICGGNWRGKRSNRIPVKWHISDISILSNLPNLTVINASNNEIVNVGRIGNLENLTKLYLNNNNIEHFPDINGLKKLREIYLSNNNIIKIDFLEGLSFIKTIDLHSNRINDLTPLKTLISKLNINDSKWEVNTISVYKNPLNIPPIEVVSKGKKSVLAYFKQLEAEKKIKLKPFINRDIKLILAGNSNAGKSTLIHYLKTKKVHKKIATTHWLKVENWLAKSNRKTFTIRAFDFGGQEYYHDTHYLFFTHRAAYVVLWEADTNRFDEIEVNQRQNDGSLTRVKIQTFSLAYWLDSIKYHNQRRRISQIEKSVEKLLDERDAAINQSVKVGEDWTKHVYSSTEKIKSVIDDEENILVTQNKIDTRKDKIFIDESSFKKDYPKIFDFTEISVYTKSGLASFQKILFEIFNNLEVVTQEYLGTWGHLKQIIEKDKFSKPLTLTEFKEYCNKSILQMPELFRKDKIQIQGVLFKEDDTHVFAEFLSDIGVCLFYPDNPVLKNKIFLNQSQILDNIYKALNGLNELDGEFTESKIGEALDKSSSTDDVTSVIELMIHFKIIFNHPSKEKTYIAPLYLPKAPPQGVKIFQPLFKKPIYRYEYKTYIQKNIVLDFFHHFGKKALKETNTDALFYYWRDGIIIRDDTTNEIVMVKFVSGNHNQQCSYLEIYQIKETMQVTFLKEVVNYFDAINQASTVTKLVPSNGDEYIPLEIIINNEREGNWIFQYENKNYDLTDFKKYLNTTIKMKKVFISYSKSDSNHLNKLENHLSVLKRNGTIGTWNCRKLLPGEKWDGKIKSELEQADLIIFLVSDDFLATDYIWDIEIKRAIERDKDPNDSVTVVPIIVRSCDWEDSPLGVYTTTPGKAQVINSSKDIDEAWTVVVKELKQILKK